MFFPSNYTETDIVHILKDAKTQLKIEGNFTKASQTYLLVENMIITCPHKNNLLTTASGYGTLILLFAAGMSVISLIMGYYTKEKRKFES